MNNDFHKPYFKELFGSEQTGKFCYTKEQLSERPIFPTYILDGGAFLFLNDVIGTTNSDDWLRMIEEGTFFEYWTYDGKFDWYAVWKNFTEKDCNPEWEAHIWIHRLYFLLPLAQAYMNTGDRRYSQKWFELLSDWIDKNPYRKYPQDPEGCPWFDMVWFDMQVAWRTINLTHSVFMLAEGGDDALTKEQWKAVYDMILLHRSHLQSEGMVKDGTSARGNHSLQIGMALIMLSCLFPEFGEPEAYAKTGRFIVKVNCDKQLTEEGIDIEDSLTYGHFIARLYFEANRLLKLNGYEPIPGVPEKLPKQYEYLYQFSSPKGITMQIGDGYAMDALRDIEFVDSIEPLPFERKKRTVVFEKSGMAVLRNNKFSVYIDMIATDPHSKKSLMAPKQKIWGGMYGAHQHFGRPAYIAYADEDMVVNESGGMNYDCEGLRTMYATMSGHNVISCDEIPLHERLTHDDSDEILSIVDHFDGENPWIILRNETIGENGKSFVWTRKIELKDKLVVTDHVKASERMHFRNHLHMPYARTGYADYFASTQPVTDDGKIINLRRRQKMQKVMLDKAGIIEYRPYSNDKNRTDVCVYSEREYYEQEFESVTVISYE
ncbi:MAG: heparinase II/III family protein [Eubacteriales bacterium]|nr:heparinase II/III family protein [Eubacteriales bacterium]